MVSTAQHWSGFPPDSYRRRLEEAFIKDSITEAAIEHLFIKLYRDDLLGLFVRAYKPGIIHTKTSADQATVHYTWSYGPCPSPEASLEPLETLLHEFVQNLNPPDPDTGIAQPVSENSEDDVVKKYADDILEYAKRMFQGDPDDDEYESEEEDADEDSEEPTDDVQLAATDIEPSTSPRSNLQGYTVQGDAASTSTEGHGAFGAITNWSFSTPDSRFQPIVNQAVTERLKDVISGAEARTAFCCGGHIPIVASVTSSTSSNSSAPIVLRFDTSDGNPAKVVFKGNATSPSGVDVLLQQCQPATFGVGGEKVHDKSYRDAVNLDPTKFSTNLHPYDLGILDSVSKTLLPSTGSVETSGRSSRLRAELYKLNVYSGPSGIFKPHVDTPRSEDQVGSLVICLPVKHEGGNLVVRHQDRTVTFCWGESDCIEWAAFYSNLEHEVEEVTKGHRVTLTYNLYWHAPLQASESLPPPASIDSLPLFGELQKVLGFGGFLPKGGMLGLYCTHSYVHNRKAKEVDLPRNLKGMDMAFFTACQALGLKVYIRPVRDPNETKWLDETDRNFNEEKHMSEDEGYHDQRRFRLNQKGEPASGDLVLKYGFEMADWKIKKNANSFTERLKRIKREREVVGANGPQTASKKAVTRLGRRFESIKSDSRTMYDDFEDCFDDNTWELLNEVIWLNKPRHGELQKAYLAYGNEPSLGLSYTYAAMVVKIPSWAKRSKKTSDMGVKT